MQITDVRIRKVEKEGKMKAVVSITIDDEFVVHDIKVIEGEKGLFIAMPSRKAGDGDFRDIAHPINSGTREKIQNTILDRYQESLEADTQTLLDQQAESNDSCVLALKKEYESRHTLYAQEILKRITEV